MQMAAEMFSCEIDEAPEFLRLDFDRLTLPQQMQWRALEHNQVVHLADLEVSVWLDRVRDVFTVWGPGVRDWYATASQLGDLEDAILLEGEPRA